MITGYQWSMYNVPWNPDHYNNISWKTGLAAERARSNLRFKKKAGPRPTRKLQAASSKALKKTQLNSTKNYTE